MTTDGFSHATAAVHFAHQASAVAADLKPGTYDSVSALALVSIAHSLAGIAEGMTNAEYGAK